MVYLQNVQKAVKDTEIKLSQYADDTTLILDGSEKSLSEALRILESFEKVSGLRLNSKKTEALWIGSCAGKSEKLHPEKDFNWQNTKVKALGVHFAMKKLKTSHIFSGSAAK